MPSEINDAPIRSQLHDDVRSAWPDVKSIHGHKPQLPKGASDLPYAVVHLAEAVNERVGVSRAVTQTLRYDITLVERFPGSQSVESRKVERANALTRILTESVSYAGGTAMDRHVAEVRFDDELDEEEKLLLVGIVFDVAMDVVE